MSSHKLDRIASDMQKYISQILLEEARDEFLKTITITSCKVSSDLGYAKIYFTSILDKDKKELEQEMNEASSFIRGRLSEKLDIRNTPELTFVFDDSIEYGKRIEDLIDKIHSKTDE